MTAAVFALIATPLLVAIIILVLANKAMTTKSILRVISKRLSVEIIPIDHPQADLTPKITVLIPAKPAAVQAKAPEPRGELSPPPKRELPEDKDRDRDK